MQNWQLLEVRSNASPEDLREAWLDLTTRSAFAAGLSRPELLAPLARVTPGIDLHAIFAEDSLLLALPIQTRGLPPTYTSWVTPLTPGGAPHFDREQGAAAFAALLRKLDRPLLLRGIPLDGPLMEALTASGEHLRVIERWQRSVLRPQGSFESWVAASLGKKRRGEFRRLKSRLSERGRLEVAELRAGANAAPFAKALLDLEAAGWKGQRGTAIRSQPRVAAAFPEICGGLHAAGALRFWQLSLDGRALACLYAIIEGGCAWLGKIAYDENFSKYSPGVLVLLEATERLFAEPGLRLADSCAIPNHPMMDNIWRDRQAIGDVLVAGPAISRMRFAALAAAETTRRKARGLARDLYYRVSGKSRS